MSANPQLHFDKNTIHDFGSASQERAALQNSAIVSPLNQFSLIRFTGEETLPFLHGQLSSDLRALEPDQIQYSSYSTPKGRMLATFLIIRDQDDYLLQLPTELHAAIQKRLSMYILRTKTRASADVRILLGVAGPQAAEQLARLGWTLPEPLHSHTTEHGTLIALGHERFELLLTTEHATQVWDQLCTAGCTPAGANTWQLSDIQVGAPWITLPTQEEFVPQMANLDLTGAVSFNKGCYPGQEIVARTQYLGKLKRRMFRVRAVADQVSAGQDIYSPEMNGQASGKILQAAPQDQNQWEALAIVQISSMEHGLHLNSNEGPNLEILDLPYPIE